MAGQTHTEDGAASLLQVLPHHRELRRQPCEAMDEQDSHAASREEKGLCPFHDHGKHPLCKKISPAGEQGMIIIISVRHTCNHDGDDRKQDGEDDRHASEQRVHAARLAAHAGGFGFLSEDRCNQDDADNRIEYH